MRTVAQVVNYIVLRISLIRAYYILSTCTYIPTAKKGGAYNPGYAFKTGKMSVACFIGYIIYTCLD